MAMAADILIVGGGGTWSFDRENNPNDERRDYNAYAQVGFSGFTIGGAFGYRQNRGGDGSDDLIYSAGITYNWDAWTVGFGYQPWLAVCWLVLFAVLGGTWFAMHPPPPVDEGQNPVFNPWLFAADTLLPIVNLGQDGYWRLDGASQWIASSLVAVGWILATTAAAGAARILKRV